MCFLLGCVLGPSLCRDNIMLLCETKFFFFFSLVSFTHFVWPEYVWCIRHLTSSIEYYEFLLGAKQVSDSLIL